MVMLRTQCKNVRAGCKFLMRGICLVKTDYDYAVHQIGYHPINALCLSGERKGHRMSISANAGVYVSSSNDLLD